MKKFTETYKNTKLDLSSLDNEIQERFSNLNAQPITECCCDCCATKCCEPCCGEIGCVNSNVYAFKTTFYSEQEIVNKILTTLTVQDIYAIFEQFNVGRIRSTDVNCILADAPLFFSEQAIVPANGNIILDYGQEIRDSKAINGFIKTISKKFGLKNPVVLLRVDGGVNIYFIANTGTNGKEGSIKNSLNQIYQLLNSLDACEEILCTDCINVSIDCADDVYAFLISISLDKMFVLNAKRTEER